MFACKLILIVAIFCTIFVAESSARRCRHKPCINNFRCSDLEQVVWAIDGSSCFVFRNECLWKSANCDRQNDHLKALKIVSKEQCQQYCRNVCTFDYNPVCGIYNGNKTTFSNPCAMTNYICATGETYSLFKNGECDSISVPV